jgi:hypothetical protein
LIEDDPKTTRDELVALRYPGWELEYRLRFLRELKNYRKMFLFTTPPRHGHLDEKGSAAVTEIIKTCNPAIVLVCARRRKRAEV